MFSNIFLNKDNLLHNVVTLSNIAQAPLCIMVKANAYGHGAKEIVDMLKEEVDCFGVSNQTEALEIRKITDKKVVVFGLCDNYQTCIEKDISFSIFSFNQLKQIVKTSKIINKTPRMELCINTGMNRYGMQEEKEFKKIINFLIKNNLSLQGIYTHFSSLTTDMKYTQRQKDKFQKFCSLLPKEWKTIKHVGGGKSIYENFEVDMFRVGMEVYGYGNEMLKPVLSIQSQIVDFQKVEKGEHVGYLCGYTAQENIKIAVIPLGYADGLPRKLSNKIKVRINNKECRGVGNICMDSFMVDTTKVNCKIGDKVDLFYNIQEIASLLETTEYEVLTNLIKFRGERKIITS